MATNSIILMYAVGLFMGLVAGFLMHRSDYCMAGMFRNFFMFGRSFRLRALTLQIVLTMIAFEVLRLFNLLPLYPFPLLDSPSLATIFGGALFGLGMVLAGGCVVGTLYRMGAGSLLSGTAFCGLILGGGLYAEIHPWWAGVIRDTTFWEGYTTLPQVVGISPTVIVLAATIAVLPLLIKWRNRQMWEIDSAVRGYIQPWKTATGIATLGVFSYLLIGMPLGVSTTYTKMAAMVENTFSAKHAAGLAFFNKTPLNVVHPASETLLIGGAGPMIDHIWVIQFPLIAGIILGSALSALLVGEFKVYYRLPARQFLITFLGGVFLGLASRMASGCNIWHLMGGIPVFAIQSLLFLTGLLPGTWLGSLLLPRLLSTPANIANGFLRHEK